MADKKPLATQTTITWDEEAIAEHDKERGTRQKIDEPKTPFVHDSELPPQDPSLPPLENLTLNEPSSSSSALPELPAPAGEPLAAPGSVAAWRGSPPPSGGGQPEPDLAAALAAKLEDVAEDQEEAARKKAEFEKKRKEHYNAGAKMKAMKAQLAAEMAAMEEDE